MIRRIRKLMATPFARPPGRRSVLGCYGPECCAGLVYLVLLVVAYLVRNSGEPFMWGALVAYLATGLVLTILPIGAAATALAGERDHQTLEMLVLTPHDHAELAWGRYWHLVWPWLRFMLWVLPIYLMLSANQFTHESPTNFRELMAASALYALGPKLGFAAVAGIGIDGSSHGDFSLWCFLLTLVRFANDALVLMLVTSVAFWISALVRRGRTALVLGYLVVLGGLGTVFSGAEWLVGVLALAANLLRGIGWLRYEVIRDAEKLVPVLYGLGVSAMLVFKVLTIVWSVGRVARNFDAYMVGEKREASP